MKIECPNCGFTEEVSPRLEAAIENFGSPPLCPSTSCGVTVMEVCGGEADTEEAG